MIIAIVAILCVGIILLAVWKGIPPKPTYMRCSTCGGIIPPGWPVSYDGEYVSHRFSTQCIKKDGNK